MGLGPVPGGNSTNLNVTAAQVIKATPGMVNRVLVVTAGSAGALTFNDAATTGAAATANAVISIPFGSLPQGAVVDLEWSFATGIVISAIPTGAQLSVSFS